MPMGTIATLDDIINLNERYDITKISYFDRVESEDGNSLIIPSTNLISIYRKYIEQYVNIFELTDRQRRIYKCRPFLLSKTIYDTPNLAWLIMFLNNQECPSKFRLKKYIRLITPANLETIYDSIVTKSQSKIEKNWADNLYL